MGSNCITGRIFTAADQVAFANLSGDHNPLHIDPVQARRFLFGDVAVHGLHTLLWALDCLCSAHEEISAVTAIKVFFDAPVTLGEFVSFTYETDAHSIFKIRVRKGRLTVLRLVVEISNHKGRPWNGETYSPALECANPSPEELGSLSGSEELTLPLQWEGMFPSLAARFSPSQVAVLLATTRIVGMSCPGLHSVFSGLRLSFDDRPLLEHELRYFVRRFDPRVNLVDIDVSCSGVEGKIQALRRPVPVEQPSFAEVLKHVVAGEFANFDALVIGGSRGLGELTAKLLAAGGARVVLTYARGADDAARIVEESQRHHFQIESRKFDVLRPPENETLARIPTHLYYFATPKIAGSKLGNFDADRFSVLIDYYVIGLTRTINWLIAQVGTKPCVIWVPSTIYVEEANVDFAEYVAAKACMELVCNHLRKTWPNLSIETHRLPRLPSDQTQSLVPHEMNNGCDLIASRLRGQL